MSTVLRISPISDGPMGRAPSGEIPQPISQPMPLMAMDIEQETPEGPKIDRIILWTNEDAARCDWCPRHKCTFRPGPKGQGNCVVRRHASRDRFDRG